MIKRKVWLGGGRSKPVLLIRTNKSTITQREHFGYEIEMEKKK